MSRTARLLEILITLRTGSRFTVQQMATTFGVSRRTMLRDLHALTEMGVPLHSTPGPGGGYALAGDRRLPPLSLGVDEALGVLLSYEAFLRQAQAPFTAQSLSAVTKLRAALPSDVVRELDRIRRHVAILERPSPYQAPLLDGLLQAALDRTHLRAVYDSMSGVSDRLIFPFGLYASQGFWYCACYDHKREMNLSLRADRFLSIEPVPGMERPAHIAIADWLGVVEKDDGNGPTVRASVSPRGTKNFELIALFGPIAVDEQGRGRIESTIPRTEIEWYAARLMQVGSDVVVEAPPELIAAMAAKAHEIAALYGRSAHREAPQDPTDVPS